MKSPHKLSSNWMFTSLQASERQVFGTFVHFFTLKRDMITETIRLWISVNHQQH